MKSVLQDWVNGLGLRHQGVLLTAIRGCDTAPKEDVSKALTRCYRAEILNCHCGDPMKALSFIEAVPWEELLQRMTAFRKSCDNYPHHYVMHVVHSAEVISYKHPARDRREPWGDFYFRMCRAMHVTMETEEAMDCRLNADEEAFGALQ